MGIIKAMPFILAGCLVSGMEEGAKATAPSNDVRPHLRLAAGKPGLRC
jgi:hypothetical protein